MKRYILISFLLTFIGITFFGCRKHTSNIIRGKWELVMIDTALTEQVYGHRSLIRQVWDFRDFKYVFIQSTLSGQAGAGPGISLDPMPIESEERRVYEIPKRRELNIIKEGTPPYTENYIINDINDNILSITRFEDGKNAGVVEFFRVSK